MTTKIGALALANFTRPELVALVGELCGQIDKLCAERLAENDKLHAKIEEWKALNRQRVNEIEKLIAEKRELHAENVRLLDEARILKLELEQARSRQPLFRDE